ncbi:MAG: carbohydrate ABC transporter permease [Deinococcota bacterium]|jgi:multiple sugar transport system permease protein|nr:carbohydrate ABC transporter permease [Deinococcota bacterium]
MRSKPLPTLTAHALLLIGALFMLIPLIWTLSTSLKAPGSEFALPIRWIPERLHVENYQTVVSRVPIARWFFNSLVVALAATVGQMLTGAMAGYAFARLKFWGRDGLFLLYLATMMIPPQVTIIPLFIIVRVFGWYDSYWALIVPGLFGAFSVFIMRQFFLTVPDELEDAAKLDGANHWQIFWRVMLPLSGPSLATLGTFTFMSFWNSFLYPLIVTSSQEMRTLTVGLSVFRQAFTTEWTLLTAGLVMSMVPVIIAFLIGQKYFIRGITMTGLK